MKRPVLTGILAIAVVGVPGAVSATRTRERKRPAVTGGWTGIWGLYAPPPLPGEQPAKPKPTDYPSMKLDCTVAEKDGKWKATFQGEAGRPYKYTIVMLGRQVGDAVLFQGAADLGPKDGGVYDWIGRATDREFIGFYTSAAHTGSFRLARPK